MGKVAAALANGVEIGTTPLPPDEVEPGEVRDEVRLAGFKRFPVGHAVATSGGHGKFRRYAGKARWLSNRGLSRWVHADFAGGQFRGECARAFRYERECLAVVRRSLQGGLALGCARRFAGHGGGGGDCGRRIGMSWFAGSAM